MDHYFGWDVGGAHLKLSRLDIAGDGGASLRTWIHPFEIWRAPDDLAARLAGILAEASVGASPTTRHAVTMTAELSDAFADRAAGVGSILRACAAALAGSPWRVLTLEGTLVPPGRAAAAPLAAAAANWMATAGLVARLRPRAIVIDTGSTTTDIIPIEEGRPAPRGRSDTERLISGELVYTGVLRTPPASLAGTLPLPGGACRVAAERFALMADAYRVLGRIGEGEYTVPTADGRDRGIEACRARLARLVCAEAADLGAEAIERMAAHLERLQVERVHDGLRQVLAGGTSPAPRTALVAGIGGFVAAAAAERAGLRAVRLSHLLPMVRGERWDDAAPSAAIALLLAEEDGRLALRGDARDNGGTGADGRNP